MNLLESDELPAGFTYPAQFTRVVGLRLENIEPWYLLEGQALRRTLSGLRTRYPSRQLVPFARRQDNDDIACWDVAQGQKVTVVHDFAVTGWEARDTFPDFWAWFRQAVEDMIAFDL